METLSRNNFAEIFGNHLADKDLSNKKAAKAIGCSIYAIDRLLQEQTLPTLEMLKRAGLLMLFGYKKFISIDEAEKVQFAEATGLFSGAAIGAAGVTTMLKSLGQNKGSNLKDIGKGLNEIGRRFGGNKGTGLLIALAVPLLSAALGYGLIKGTKLLFTDNNLYDREIDKQWEIAIEN